MQAKFNAKISDLENSKGDKQSLMDQVESLQQDLGNSEAALKKIKDLNRQLKF